MKQGSNSCLQQTKTVTTTGSAEQGELLSL
jgi:hypothetical protein